MQMSHRADRGGRGPGALERWIRGGTPRRPGDCGTAAVWSRSSASRGFAAAPGRGQSGTLSSRSWATMRTTPGPAPGRCHRWRGNRRAGTEDVDRARPARILARRYPPEPVAAGIPASQAGKNSLRAGTGLAGARTR
jgi:hypothetical protein